MTKSINKIMSPNIFAFLHSLIDGKGAKLEELNQITFRAVLYRKYVKVDKYGGLYLTDSGHEAYERYTESEIPLRQKPSELSETVKKLLHLRSVRLNQEKVITTTNGSK